MTIYFDESGKSTNFMLGLFVTIHLYPFCVSLVWCAVEGTSIIYKQMFFHLTAKHTRTQSPLVQRRKSQSRTPRTTTTSQQAFVPSKVHSARNQGGRLAIAKSYIAFTQDSPSATTIGSKNYHYCLPISNRELYNTATHSM